MMVPHRGCFVALLALIIISSHAFAVEESECLKLTKRALLQIKQNHSDSLLPSSFRNWDGNFSEGHSPVIQGNPLTVGFDSMLFFCRGGLKSGKESATGATLTKDGITAVGIDRNEIHNIEDYKAVLFHELVHAGIAVQVNKSALSSLNVYSAQCDEVLAHAKTLMMMQSLDGSSPEFGGRNISKSKSYLQSMTLLEKFIKNCMKSMAATEENIDSILKDYNVKPDDQQRAKAEYKKIMEILRKEIGRIRLGIMEKKIMHMRSDGRIDSSENKTLEGIRVWLNVSSSEYKGIYNEIAFADLPHRLEGPLPASVSKAGVASDGVLIAVALQNGDKMTIPLVSENGMMKIKPQLQTENRIEVSEGTLTGILTSLDREGAIKVALASSEISVNGNFGTPVLAYSRILRIQQSFSPQFSPGSRIQIGQNSVALARSAHGLTLAQLPNNSQTLVLNRYGGILGYTTAGAMRLANYNPGQLSPSAGIYMQEGMG